MRQIFLALLLLASPALAAAGAQSGVSSEMRAEAGKYFQAKEWAKAADAYEAITRLEPNNGGAWYRLGYSRHLLGKHALAAEAYEKAAAITAGPLVLFNLACAYSLTGDQEKAYGALERAINAGFTNIETIKSDPDLAGLRSAARFAELMKLAEKRARPCEFDERFRQFDFWVGDWDVRTQQGALAGRNLIEHAENGCLMIENWTSNIGGSGKSVNFFDPALGKWRQVWVSSTGQVGEFTGEYKDGEMRFLGESHAPNGNRVTSRLTFFNLGQGKVRQLGEQSNDGGKTWTVSYDLYYTLRK